MPWFPQWLTIPVAFAAGSFALRAWQFYRARRRPKLALTVKCSGSNNEELVFSVYVSEVSNLVPARGIVARASIDGHELYERQPFNLAAGQQDRRISVSVPRPAYGDLVPACINAPTLYGRPLKVTLKGENGAKAEGEWREEAYDQETDAGRYEAMREAWAKRPK